MSQATISQPKTCSLLRRPRRNRKSASIRKLIEETTLKPSNFVVPYFVTEGVNQKLPIPSLPGSYILSVDQLLKDLENLHAKGATASIIFPVVDQKLKDASGSEALNPDGLIPRSIQTIKKELPNITLISDVALDPYSSHGHDGLINESQEIVNDESLEILGKQALLHAQAGVDIIAPSDMMDGRVGYIRNALDFHNFTDVSILSYTAKFSSSLYKGYRDVVGSKLTFGDKLTYQLSPANTSEALLEAKEDIKEGADMLLVKPGGFYLDIISKIKQFSDIPIGAFQVSGEYSMIMAADKLGYLDGKKVLEESLLALKRAGADFIITYGANQLLCEMNNT